MGEKTDGVRKAQLQRLDSHGGHYPIDLGGSRFRFFAVMLSIYLVLETVLAVYVIRWDHFPSVLLFGVLSVLFLGGTYGMTKEILSLKGGAPIVALDRLSTSPKVALLYATMNDVVPECLASMEQDYPVDVYVLDDSSDPSARAKVDRISHENGYTVVRREQRRGYKAGATNEWLARYGSAYDYIMLFDADSYLPPDWVGEALRYAEHPANKDVAIFQGLINVWNLDTEFVSTLAPMSKLGQFVWERNLANSVDAIFCYGHNAMVRISALAQVGGFVEGYVSEDFATAAALAQKGWHSRFVPLHTYEAVPENIRGFIRRQNKWTRGSMEFFDFASRPSISADRRFHLLQIPLSHVANLLAPFGALLTVYGFASTPAAAASFLALFVGNPLGVIWSVPILRLLLLWGLFGSALGSVVRSRAGVSLREHVRHRVLSVAISAVMVPYEAKSMASYFVTRLRQIPVTPKSEKPLSPSGILQVSSYSLAFQGLLLYGIFSVNPLGAVFNVMWLGPMLLSPYILLRFSGYTRRPASASHLWKDEMSLSSLRSDPSKVHMHLATVVATGESRLAPIEA